MKKTARAIHLLRKFGITEEQYDDLYRAQEGRCGVCQRPSSDFRTRLAVDHDHASGHIRGLLCFNCNKYIVGRHRKEHGAQLLLKAYYYLTNDYPGWIVPPRIKRKKRRGKKLRSKGKKDVLH